MPVNEWAPGGKVARNYGQSAAANRQVSMNSTNGDGVLSMDHESTDNQQVHSRDSKNKHPWREEKNTTTTGTPENKQLQAAEGARGFGAVVEAVKLRV